MSDIFKLYFITIDHFLKDKLQSTWLYFTGTIGWMDGLIDWGRIDDLEDDTIEWQRDEWIDNGWKDVFNKDSG